MSDAAFTGVTALIALISDPKGCAKRMAELQATIEVAEKAQAQLAVDRAVHERAIAEANRELDGRRLKIAEDECHIRLQREGLKPSDGAPARRRHFPVRPKFRPRK
jgi:hypothetical protein